MTTDINQEPACSCLSTDARECYRWRNGIGFSEIGHDDIEPCDCSCHSHAEDNEDG